MISDEKSLLKFSVCFGFDPSSLRKALKNKQVSRYLVKRLLIALGKDINLNFAFLKSSRVRKILFIFRLYQEKGTLENVGKEMNLSRERIRQLPNQGTQLGLFDFQKLCRPSLPNIPKKKIVENFKSLLQFGKVAKINYISTAQLYKLLNLSDYQRGPQHTTNRRGKIKMHLSL